MRINKSVQVVLSLIISLLLFSTPVFASKQKGIELTPAPGNYINLESVQLIQTSDDNVSFTVKGHREAGAEPIGFSIEVDTKNKTYKTAKKRY